MVIEFGTLGAIWERERVTMINELYESSPKCYASTNTLQYTRHINYDAYIESRITFFDKKNL